MSIITQSLSSSKISHPEISTPIPFSTPKDLPIKVNLPTLSPPSVPMDEPSFLEALNSALVDLHKELDPVSESMDESLKPHLKEQVIKRLDQVIERLPKGALDISQVTYFDHKRFIELVRPLINKIQWSAGWLGFEENQWEKVQTTNNALLQLNQSIKEAIEPLRKKKDADKRDLDFGTCLGDSVAHTKALSLDKEITRTGRFFHCAHKFIRALEKGDAEYPRELGKFLLDHPEECPPLLIQQLAGLLKIECIAGQEMSLIKLIIDEKAPLPRMAIEKLLGKFAPLACSELTKNFFQHLEKLPIKEKRLEEIAQKLASSEIGAQEVELLNSEKRELIADIAKLKSLIAFYESELFNGIIHPPQAKQKASAWDIPEKILKRHGISEKGVVVERTPIQHLPEKLKVLSNKKGTFCLNLDGNGPIGHAVLISFDPPSFIDINDTYYSSGKRKMRTFKTENELLEFIPHYILGRPEPFYEAMNVVRYEKFSPAITASSSKVEKADVIKRERTERKE